MSSGDSDAGDVHGVCKKSSCKANTRGAWLCIGSPTMYVKAREGYVGSSNIQWGYLGSNT